MPKQVGKSALGDRLAKSLQGHARDKTTAGPDYTRLPAGITGGIAQLTEAKIGVYAKGNNAGEKFIYLAGTVIEPKTFMEVKQVWAEGKVMSLPPREVTIEGLFTSQILPLCDTTNASGEVTNADDHIARALNELRLLGGDDFTEDIDSEESLAEHLATLKKVAPVFRFSTSSGAPTAQYPNERVWENWRGAKGLEDYEPPEEGDAVVDGTPDDEERIEPTAKAPPKKSPKIAAPVPEEEEEEADLDALAVKADEGDEDAQKAITDAANVAGIEDETIAEAEDWASVVALIGSSGEGEEPEEEEEEEAADPEKGDVYFFKPPKARKPVECEVTAVFAKAQKVNLKSLDDGKSFKMIPFDKLTQE